MSEGINLETLTDVELHNLVEAYYDWSKTGSTDNEILRLMIDTNPKLGLLIAATDVTKEATRRWYNTINKTKLKSNNSNILPGDVVTLDLERMHDKYQHTLMYTIIHTDKVYAISQKFNAHIMYKSGTGYTVNKLANDRVWLTPIFKNERIVPVEEHQFIVLSYAEFETGVGLPVNGKIFLDDMILAITSVIHSNEELNAIEMEIASKWSKINPFDYSDVNALYWEYVTYFETLKES